MIVSSRGTPGGRSPPQSNCRPVTHAPRHDGAESALVGLVRRVEAVPEHLLAPRDLAVDGGGVGVEEQLGRVAAQALAGCPRAVDPEPVALARADLGEERRARRGRSAPELEALLVPVAVEEAHLDGVGDLGGHGEVGPFGGGGGTSGKGWPGRTSIRQPYPGRPEQDMPGSDGPYCVEPCEPCSWAVPVS